jgi:hypothetical protein
MNIQPFTPGPTLPLAVGTTSTAVQLTGGAAVEVSNTGSATMFIKLGGAGVAAATTDYPIPAGQAKLIGRDPNNQTWLAAVTASGSTTGYVTTGEGM